MQNPESEHGALEGFVNQHGHGKFPQKLILPTRDLLEEFFFSVGGDALGKGDLEEIMAQVTVALFDGPEGMRQRINALPDRERFVGINSIANTVGFSIFNDAVRRLAEQLHQRLLEYDAYTDNDFPYYFDRMIQHDTMLTHFPF